MLVLLKEIEHILAVGVIIGGVEQRLAGARTRQVDIGELADARLRTVGHHHHPVGEQDRFVDVVGDQHADLLVGLPDLLDLVAEVGAGECVERRQRLVERARFFIFGKTASSASLTLPWTVSQGISEQLWKITPRSGPGPVIGLPLQVTVPVVGNSRPAIRLMSVVLPVPEKPSSTRNSPASTARSMFWSTRVAWMPSP